MSPPIKVFDRLLERLNAWLEHHQESKAMRIFLFYGDLAGKLLRASLFVLLGLVIALALRVAFMLHPAFGVVLVVTLVAVALEVLGGDE